MAASDAPSATTPSLHGFLIIDKPAGWTSHDVVARARRLLNERRIGHAGTLDPAATGVLPLAVGSATRVVEYLAESSKTYLAEITFGVATDSHDADGQVTDLQDATALTRDLVEGALPPFRGPLRQIPPMHAAIKIGGKRLYELARRGEAIERQPRAIEIHELRLIAWEAPVATLVVDCSKGTYIRALARDLGAALGVGAHLSNLIRLRTGPFVLDDALTLTQLAHLPLPWGWPVVAFHPDTVLTEWPALILDHAASIDWGHGKPIAAGAESPTTFDQCRVYDGDGAWLGIGGRDAEANVWRPLKVIERAA